MSRRTAVRTGIIAAGLAVSAVASTAPALATVKVAGQHYPSLGLTNTVLLFVALPLGIFAVVAGLAVLPSEITRRRYAKTVQPWDYPPVLIGPANPRGVIAAEVAAAAAQYEAAAEQLASAASAATTARVLASAGAGADAGPAATTARGGASAEW